MISTNVLVDPSLILSRDTYKGTFCIMKDKEIKKRFSFYLPLSFSNLILEDKLHLDSPIIQYFLSNSQPCPLDKLKELLEERRYLIGSYKEEIFIEQDPYRYLYSLESVNPDKFIDSLDKTLLLTLKENLKDGQDLFNIYSMEEYNCLYEILFEEWIFLHGQSWIVSKIRKQFDLFIQAGSVCLEHGRWTLDPMVRLTVKKPHDELLTRVDYLRAMAKWVAVGGPTALGYIKSGLFPMSSVYGGYFLLFDP